ncbi:MAG TPA: glucoamylase family protein [Steroidobacteraceae bacterium]|nr:glucoamylase family protein [Steroidobacteraceae bacterium]
MRRAALLLLGGAIALLPACKTPAPKKGIDPVVVHAAPMVPARRLDPLFDDIEKRTFNFFWDTAEPGTGLVPDRWPRPPFSSTAAIGFALNSYAIGVERGYITRAQARERVLTTLRFLLKAPQSSDPATAAGYQGFFYHFLNFTTGARYGGTELSTVDTALLMAGVLFVRGYFNEDQPDEVELRKIASELYERVNWPWAIEHVPDIRMAWSPEGLFGKHDWRGYNEAMLVFILALGSPTYPAATRTWDAWTSDYYRSWGTLEGQTHLTFGPMFGHQFSAVWIDYRGIKDEFIWPQGIDYFENSRRATLAQRAYAIRNPMDWKGYGPNIWGLTASDGPVDIKLPYLGQTRQFYSYAARGVGLYETIDDGTVAPNAVLGSLPFAPEIVEPAIEAMHDRYGRYIYGKYGFVGAFNPSFDYDIPVRHGRRVRGVGWVDSDYLGIDQGVIISMIENYRSELIWSVMKRDPNLRRGLERAGFEGGWLSRP